MCELTANQGIDFESFGFVLVSGRDLFLEVDSCEASKILAFYLKYYFIKVRVWIIFYTSQNIFFL